MLVSGGEVKGFLDAGKTLHERWGSAAKPFREFFRKAGSKWFYLKDIRLGD